MKLIPKKAAQSRINGAKSAGRAKGAVSPDMAMLKAKCRKLSLDLIAELKRLALRGESEGTRIAAIKELLDRGYGRPVQGVAVGIGGEDGSTATIVISTGVPRPDIGADIGAIPHFPGTPKSDSLTD